MEIFAYRRHFVDEHFIVQHFDERDMFDKHFIVGHFVVKYWQQQNLMSGILLTIILLLGILLTTIALMYYDPAFCCLAFISMAFCGQEFSYQWFSSLTCCHKLFYYSAFLSQSFYWQLLFKISITRFQRNLPKLFQMLHKDHFIEISLHNFSHFKASSKENKLLHFTNFL